MFVSVRKVLTGLLFAFSFSVCAFEKSTGVDEQAKLPYWQISSDMMSLRLVQRLPMQTRAFFLARGFNKEQTEKIAQSCVFQTVFKNLSHNTSNPSVLTYNLEDWEIIHQGETRSLMTREKWERIWKRERVAKSVRLAFEWALYPTEQNYQPGDYNWGMSVYGLEPGSVFDLKVVWKQSGKRHEVLLDDIQCAEDLDLQPGDVSR
jgi:hypothetical protein